MIEIVAIKPELLDQAWPVAAPFVEKVLPHNRGQYSLADVRRDIERGESLLLLVLEGQQCLAAVVCTFEEQQGKRVLHMPIVAGDRLDEWSDICHQTIPRIAKEYGCSMVTGRGRRGWIRKLAPYGYKELYTVFGMEIEH